MKVLKIIAIVIASIAILIALAMWYIGIFATVTPVEKEMGGYVLVGKEFKGAYMKVGPTMTEVDKQLRSMGIECAKGFGVYYDNPNVVPQDSCRSYVGNILEEADSATIAEIIASGLKVDSLPLAPAVVVEFPTKNTISYMIGPMKAYPALTKYMQDNNITAVTSCEIYDVPNKVTYYIMQY